MVKNVCFLGENITFGDKYIPYNKAVFNNGWKYNTSITKFSKSQAKYLSHKRTAQKSQVSALGTVYARS